MPSNNSFATRAVHGGEERTKPHHALTTPIVQTSTFTFADTADLIGFKKAYIGGDETERSEYGRYGNPTVTAVERKLAELDSGEAALLFSSGMAAVTTTLLMLLSAGTHVVMTDDCYRRTRQFVTQFLKRYDIESTLVAVGDYEALEAAIRPDTRLILSESPTNPYLRVVDVPRLVEIARRHQLKTVIDGTFATPINQRPLEFGVDFVIHSATKYLGGHNDLLAGAVVGSDDLIAGLRAVQGMMGAVCDPHTAYLLLRGLKTLELRVRRQFNPTHPGTRIVESPNPSRQPLPAIISTTGLSMIAIGSQDDAWTLNLAVHALAHLSQRGLDVLMFSQSFSEHNLNLIVREQDQAHCLKILNREFKNGKHSDAFNLETKEQVATISVVGAPGQGGLERHWNGTGIVSHTFSALGRHGTRVIAVAQAATEHSVSFCVPEDQVADTVRYLHRELGLEGKDE